MGLVVRTCVALTCDLCGDGWAQPDAEPHFTGRREAAAYARTAGWVVTRARALCPECTAVEACGLSGHHWSGWTPAGPRPTTDGGTWQGRVRYCLTCTSAEWDPPARRHGPRRQAG